MAPFALQMTVMAAEDLKNVATFGKMNLYTVAWVDPYMRAASRILRKSSRNPVWNDEVTLSLECIRHCPNAWLTVQIFCESSLGDKVVGTARLPMQEVYLIAPSSDEADPAVVTLRLQRPSGRIQGILSLSMRLTGDAQPTAPSAPLRLTGGSLETTPSAGESSYPIVKYGTQEPVMGIPVPAYSGPYYETGPSVGTTSTGYPSLEAAYDGPYIFPPSTYQGYPGYHSHRRVPYSYVQRPQSQNRSSGSLLLGLLGGALGGLILGDILS